MWAVMVSTEEPVFDLKADDETRVDHFYEKFKCHLAYVQKEKQEAE